MEQNTQEKVIHILTGLPDLTKKIDLLRFEIDECGQVSRKEMLDALAFSRGDGISSASGHISNKTLYIALNYEEKAQEINTEAKASIVREIRQLEREKARITHYISLLESELAQIINLTYIEKKRDDDIAKILGVAPKTVSRHRKLAIDRLCKMYSFVEGFR